VLIQLSRLERSVEPLLTRGLPLGCEILRSPCLCAGFRLDVSFCLRVGSLDSSPCLRAGFRLDQLNHDSKTKGADLVRVGALFCFTNAMFSKG
jgi:hypothetical protein